MFSVEKGTSQFNLVVFLAILLLAVFLRCYRLDSFPPALTWDEVSIGYNAYSILKTGKDEWGEFLPLTFKAFGDYKLPVYIYADVPFVAMFGLTEWGARAPSFLAGLGIVILIYLITKKTLKDNRLALWGMFLAALTPWFIIMSRVALEAHLAAFLTLMGVYFFLRGTEKSKFLILAALCFGASFFCYNSNRVIVLPLVLGGIYLYRKSLDLKDRYTIVSLGLVLLSLLIVIPLAFLQDSSARYKWTKILDEGAILRINERRADSSLPAPISRVTHNKLTYFIPEALRNYLSYFSFNYLYQNGSSNYQHSVPRSGLLPWISLPLFMIGLYAIYKNREKYQLLMLVWLLVAPFAGAITRDAPHAPRSATLGIPFLLICVYGLSFLSKQISQKQFQAVVGVLSLVLVFNLSYFINNYTGDYPKKYSWSWQYGYQQVADIIRGQGEQYSRIVITKKYGEPHIFLLFFLKYDPAKYMNNPNLIRYIRSDWFWVDQFDKYQFINDWEVKEKLANQSNLLLITSPGNYPEGGQVISAIKFLDGRKAFEIVRL